MTWYGAVFIVAAGAAWYVGSVLLCAVFVIAAIACFVAAGAKHRRR